MRRVAVVGFASSVGAPDGRNDAELLAPVVDQAIAASGLTREDLGVVCTASSEFLNGVVGSMMGAFDAFPGWPPRTHTHHDGDGAFALYEAWIRLLNGEADAALVCAFSRPLSRDVAEVLAMQLDPYLVAPLAVDVRALAALQARALIDAGRYGEVDLTAVACARRSGLDVNEVLRQPYVASPLRAADCSTACAGAAAVVLAVDEHTTGSRQRPAWIAGIDHRLDTRALGMRDLAVSASTQTAAVRLGIAGSSIDVLELHAPFSHQELIVLDAIDAADIGELNPSGGALPADPVMATGLIRIGAAASAIGRGDARRAVAHATNGPCLQHNLLCVLEGV